MDAQSLIAAGWKDLRPNDFAGSVGPFWYRGRGPELTLGLLTEPRHANAHRKTVHGGALMTFADIALGFAVAEMLGGPYCVTVDLQLQFVAAAPTERLLTCKPELVRRTSQLVFMRALLCVDDAVVASANGVWKVLEPRPS
jgi:acyl-coenzyme A thioesterase PaaI-like protein